LTTYSGREALVAVKTDNTVAYTDASQTQSVSFDFDGGLEEIYHLGSRDPQEIKEGSIAISGTISRLFESGNYSAAGMTFADMAIKDTAGVLTEMWIAIFPSGAATPKVVISNAKFGGYSISADIGGIVTESVTFRGLAIAVA